MTIPQTIGAMVTSELRKEPAALLADAEAEVDDVEVELEPVPEEAAVTDGWPDPAVAVPLLAVPAFWDPAPLFPLRPGPVPAPCLRYLVAPAGIAGRESSATSHVSDLGGHEFAVPEVLAPPLPLGFGVALKAD